MTGREERSGSALAKSCVQGPAAWPRGPGGVTPRTPRRQTRARVAPPPPFASIASPGGPPFGLPWAWPPAQPGCRHGAAAGADKPQQQHETRAAASGWTVPRPLEQQQQQQQQQQQPWRPFWAAPGGGGPGPLPASATTSTVATAALDHAHRLHILSRAVNTEAAKVAGLFGAQLALSFAALQRGLGSGGGGAAFTPPWAGLRLPWQRDAGADGTRGGAHGGAHGAHGAAAHPHEAARRWLDKGAAAERALDLREALACYQSAVTLEPGGLENVCRLAKQWSDLTYEPGASTAEIVAANEKAIVYADRAIALAPKAAAGWMASCVSRGRLALFSDNKAKVRLAKEAREAAATAVELEPGNDLAHHLMGRWHYEMASINFVVRQLIKIVYGASLAPGTLSEALAEYQAAAALAPAKLIHRVELGRVYLRLGRRQEALRELEASVRMDVEDVNAHLQRADAAAMLRKEFGRAVTPLVVVEEEEGGGGGGGGAAAGAAGAA